MRVLYHSRNRRPDAEERYGVTYASMDELLAQCEENAPGDDEDRAWLEARPVGNELL